MLENFDNTWRESGGDNISTFINVPPGKYRFRVECLNIDGIKSEKAISHHHRPTLVENLVGIRNLHGLLILIFSVFMNRALERARHQSRATKSTGEGTGPGKRD